MISIFIADDHELIRESLKKILLEEADILVTGEASNSKEILENISKTDCDIIILDMNMPGRSGLDLIPDLKIHKPGLKILMFSIHDEHIYALRAIKAGANGYISKNAALRELVVAIRKIYSQGKYLSSVLTEELALEICFEKPHLPHEELTNREFEIMCLIASDHKVSDIAAFMSLSINTVNTYRSRIFEKLRVNSNVELTHYVVNAGIFV
jgi:DNA-binding NarL/FixJ family response regulator